MLVAGGGQGRRLHSTGRGRVASELKGRGKRYSVCVCVGELGRVYGNEEGEEGDEGGQARVAAHDEASVTTKEDSMLSMCVCVSLCVPRLAKLLLLEFGLF